MMFNTPIIYVLGPPGAGKTTICTHLTETYPISHISVGDLLRRIRDDPTHMQGAAIASALSTRDVVKPQILNPILREEMERVVERDRGTRALLLDGFPRSLEQMKAFEEEFGESKLLITMYCSRAIARQRSLTRNVKGRENDDEALFTKRYLQSSEQTGDIVQVYERMDCAVDVHVGGEMEETLALVRDKLEENAMWVHLTQEQDLRRWRFPSAKILGHWG